jgi:hypothetical protein
LRLAGLVAAIRIRDAAQATSAWVAIDANGNGLGGGVELVGGVWVLLISAASSRSAAFPKVLGYLGVVVGLAGVLTVVPMLKDLATVFGISQILWFASIGIVMLRRIHS